MILAQYIPRSTSRFLIELNPLPGHGTNGRVLARCPSRHQTAAALHGSLHGHLTVERSVFIIYFPSRPCRSRKGRVHAPPARPLPAMIADIELLPDASNELKQAIKTAVSGTGLSHTVHAHGATVKGQAEAVWTAARAAFDACIAAGASTETVLLKMRCGDGENGAAASAVKTTASAAATAMVPQRPSPFGSGVRKLQVVDCHCGGEPARVIVGGMPHVHGASMVEVRQRFAKARDSRDLAEVPPRCGSAQQRRHPRARPTSSARCSRRAVCGRTSTTTALSCCTSRAATRVRTPTLSCLRP